MKDHPSRIEAFKIESRSDLIQYIVRDIAHFEELKIISAGFQIRENIKVDALAMDGKGCAVVIKAVLDCSDSDLIDLFREVNFINQHLPFIRKNLSVSAMSTVFPARGLLISPSFSKRFLEALETLSKSGIELFTYRPISVNGERFLWIGKFPIKEEHEYFDNLLEKAEEAQSKNLKISKEEIEEFKNFEKERI